MFVKINYFPPVIQVKFLEHKLNILEFKHNCKLQRVSKPNQVLDKLSTYSLYLSG